MANDSDPYDVMLGPPLLPNARGRFPGHRAVLARHCTGSKSSRAEFTFSACRFGKLGVTDLCAGPSVDFKLSTEELYGKE